MVTKKLVSIGSKFKEDEKITLELLSTLNLENKTTQRSISTQLGIALGLTNSYLKRCVDKGLVKIKQIPRNRYAYYLTTRGFTEKARLTAEFLKISFQFYRDAKEDCKLIIEKCLLDGNHKVLLSDISELAEIFILSSLDSQLNIVGIYNNKINSYLGIKTFNNYKATDKYDVIILTTIKDPERKYKELLKTFRKEQIIIPRTLSIKIKE